MPARSKILTLPEEIKAELDRRLIAGSFSGYTALAEWLQDQGVEISRTAVHNYGQEFEQTCKAIKIATEQAKAIVSVIGDDADNMGEALIRLIQQLTFDILIKNKDGDLGAILPKMGVMVAKISRASVGQKKFAAEARKKVIEEAADTVEQAAAKEGVSQETIKRIRRDVLMMAE